MARSPEARPARVAKSNSHPPALRTMFSSWTMMRPGAISTTWLEG